MTPISLLWLVGALAGIYLGITQNNHLTLLISALTLIVAISTWFGQTGAVKVLIVALAISLLANFYGIIFGDGNNRYIMRASVQLFFLITAGYWIKGKETEKSREQHE